MTIFAFGDLSLVFCSSINFCYVAVAERLRQAYPTLLEWAGVGSDAQNVPSFRRWRFEMKLSPFVILPYFMRSWCLVWFTIQLFCQENINCIILSNFLSQNFQLWRAQPKTNRTSFPTVRALVILYSVFWDYPRTCFKWMNSSIFHWLQTDLSDTHTYQNHPQISPTHARPLFKIPTHAQLRWSSFRLICDFVKAWI